MSTLNIDDDDDGDACDDDTNDDHDDEYMYQIFDAIISFLYPIFFHLNKETSLHQGQHLLPEYIHDIDIDIDIDVELNWIDGIFILFPLFLTV